MRKGFTLIELLIVIAIIAVLAVAFLPSVLNAPAKARDAQRIEDVGKIAKFFTLQYSVKGTFPLTTYLDPVANKGTDAVKLINASLSDFGGVFPKDPAPGNNGGKSYLFYGMAKTSPYAFLVVAFVEIEDNGNMDATDASNFYAGKASLKESGPYYVVAVQK